jgi:predicted RNase H-like nuclease (RuvC/YqgF family)
MDIVDDHERDEPRAENERLQERAAYAERVWRELGASREQLQAEVERLRAEVKRLRAVLDEIAAEDDE